MRRLLALGLLPAALGCRAGEPLQPAPAPMPGVEARVEPRPAASTYAAIVAPILQGRCVACHGPEQVKGKLRLDSPEGILAGGDSGPALAAGPPEASELLRRLLLPLSDSDHMPPKGKPQPSRSELLALRDWVAAGAPFEGTVAGIVAPGAEEAPPALPPAPPGALEALRGELVHVEELAPGSNALWIDFASVAEHVDDSRLARLLSPVRDQIVELSLARTRVSDRGAALFARLPRLRRLDLRDTPAGDGVIEALAACAELEELVLARTAVTPASTVHLAALPRLRCVHLWGTSFDGPALGALRARAPALRVEAGDAPPAAVSRIEESVTFTSDAPIVDLPPPGAPGAPVNVRCPVTGSPVNPRHMLEHGGRRVAFCCANCPDTFRADPDKYPVPGI